MNYLFTIDQRRREGLLNVIFILIIIFFSHSVSAQVLEPDLVDVSRTWQDRNGDNKLSIKVYAACNPDKGPLDGHKTMIKASLKNSKYKIEKKYNEKNYQMCMIFFDPADIVLKPLDGSEAIFIPFFIVVMQILK